MRVGPILFECCSMFNGELLGEFGELLGELAELLAELAELLGELA